MDLSNSVPFDSNIDYEKSDAISATSKFIRAEIGLLGRFDRWHARHTNHLKLIILNLLHSYSVDPAMYVAYSRAKGGYSRPKRYESIELRYESMVKIADALKDMGYIESRTGYYDRGKGVGKNARMIATRKLINLLTVTYGLDGDGVIRSPDEETVILKDKNKELIDYAENSTVSQMRANLKVINDRIEKSFIGLCVDDDCLARIREELKREASEDEGKIRKVIDFSKKKLRRIFNNSSFEEGGRFYNGWWQEIPSKYRKHIRIDDMGTCEIDFSGLHINMLYAIEGLPLPTEDVYTLDGIPIDARGMLKTILQILLNAENEKKALTAICKMFPRREHPEVFASRVITHKKIMAAFKDKHRALSKYFCSGYGVKLQFVDSQIAEEVLLMLAEKDIVALPVHDSFIVQRIHRNELVEAMNEAVSRRFKVPFKLKESLAAYDVGMRILDENVLPDALPVSIDEFESKWIDKKDCKRYLALHEKHLSMSRV